MLKKGKYICLHGADYWNTSRLVWPDHPHPLHPEILVSSLKNAIYRYTAMLLQLLVHVTHVVVWAPFWSGPRVVWQPRIPGYFGRLLLFCDQYIMHKLSTNFCACKKWVKFRCLHGADYWYTTQGGLTTPYPPGYFGKFFQKCNM